MVITDNSIWFNTTCQVMGRSEASSKNASQRNKGIENMKKRQKDKEIGEKDGNTQMPTDR